MGLVKCLRLVFGLRKLPYWKPILQQPSNIYSSILFEPLLETIFRNSPRIPNFRNIFEKCKNPGSLAGAQNIQFGNTIGPTPHHPTPARFEWARMSGNVGATCRPPAERCTSRIFRWNGQGLNGQVLANVQVHKWGRPPGPNFNNRHTSLIQGPD